MSVIINGKKIQYKEGLKAIDFIEEGNKNIITCKVNNKLRDLSYCFSDNSNVELLGLWINLV